MTEVEKAAREECKRRGIDPDGHPAAPTPREPFAIDWTKKNWEVEAEILKRSR